MFYLNFEIHFRDTSVYLFLVSFYPSRFLPLVFQFLRADLMIFQSEQTLSIYTYIYKYIYVP